MIYPITIFRNTSAQKSSALSVNLSAHRLAFSHLYKPSNVVNSQTFNRRFTYCSTVFRKQCKPIYNTPQRDLKWQHTIMQMQNQSSASIRFVHVQPTEKETKEKQTDTPKSRIYKSGEVIFSLLTYGALGYAASLALEKFRRSKGEDLEDPPLIEELELFVNGFNVALKNGKVTQEHYEKALDYLGDYRFLGGLSSIANKQSDFPLARLGFLTLMECEDLAIRNEAFKNLQNLLSGFDFTKEEIVNLRKLEKRIAKKIDRLSHDSKLLRPYVACYCLILKKILVHCRQGGYYLLDNTKAEISHRALAASKIFSSYLEFNFEAYACQIISQFLKNEKEYSLPIKEDVPLFGRDLQNLYEFLQKNLQGKEAALESIIYFSQLDSNNIYDEKFLLLQHILELTLKNPENRVLINEVVALISKIALSTDAIFDDTLRQRALSLLGNLDLTKLPPEVKFKILTTLLQLKEDIFLDKRAENFLKRHLTRAESFMTVSEFAYAKDMQEIKEAEKKLSIVSRLKFKNKLREKLDTLLSQDFLIPRDDKINQIFNNFNLYSRDQTLVIKGAMGSGKSTLALMYALKFAKDYKSIHWIDADSFKSDFLALLKNESFTERHKSLLIIDNVNRENWEIVESFTRRMEYQLLITTTEFGDTNLLYHYPTVFLFDFSELESMSYLLRNGNYYSPDEVVAAKKLIAELQRSPLSLSFVRQYILKTSVSFSEYLRKLQERKKNLSSDSSVFSLSADLIKQVNPLAFTLLQFLSQFEIVPFSLIRNWKETAHIDVDENNIINALVELKTLGFIEGSGSYRVRLEINKESLPFRKELNPNSILAFAKTVASLKLDDSKDYSEMQLLLPQCEKLVKNSKREIDPASGYLILQKMSQYYFQTGNLHEAHAYADSALSKAVRMHKIETNLDVANAHFQLGQIFDRQHDFRHASECYEKALVIKKQINGADHPDTKIILDCLNMIKETQKTKMEKISAEGKKCAILEADGDLIGAAQCYKNEYLQKIDYYKKSKHPEVLEAYFKYGTILQLQGDLREAKKIYKEVLVEARDIYPTDLHPKMAKYFHQLGIVAQKEKKYEKAKAYYDHALSIRRELYKSDPDQEDIVASLYQLGKLSKKQNDLIAARTYYEQALSMMKKIDKSESNPKALAIKRSLDKL